MRYREALAAQRAEWEARLGAVNALDVFDRAKLEHERLVDEMPTHTQNMVRSMLSDQSPTGENEDEDGGRGEGVDKEAQFREL